MNILQPQSLPLAFNDWKQLPYRERIKILCQVWAVQGYGAPPAVYGFYLLKIVFYIWMWTWFTSFSTGLGGLNTIGAWWHQPEALLKAVVWSMLFEGLGLASGSGPLTGRYNPPFGGFLYFLRPSTVKVPFIPGMPLLGGDTRRWFDCLLYLLHVAQLIRILIAPEVTPALLWPTVVLLPLMGITDRALYLSARSEHYLIGIICFLLPQDAIAGSKIVWFGVWIWAATSKLNRHFPSVISVMLSNSGIIRSEAFRKRLFRNYPEDLRASALATNLSHFGTVTEYIFPLLLMFGPLIGHEILGLGTPLTLLGLLLMLSFHTFITANVPMGVPIEWNIMMVYGAFVLFGAHADVWAMSIESPLLIETLGIGLLMLPLLGNLFPAWVSFLMGMRYYAGNWAYSVWLFRDDAEEKIANHVTTSAPLLMKQLGLLYDEDTAEGILSRVISFRLMHMHGRALHDLIPKAVGDMQDIDRYTWRDGELVAGVVIGWNFGDGHLHNEVLLASLQKRCQWKSGEVRCIFVDPQPFGRPHLDWRIFDAKDGIVARGRVGIDELIERQPFPT
ncbi:MAG: DUF3556 domain-containing protein [Chloroflexota bacterium]